MTQTFHIQTLGCKANTYDTALLRAELVRRGWHGVAEGQAADLVVINSCTVTDEADRESRKVARRAARRHPGARVVMTGCGAEVDPVGMAAAAGVDAVIGNQDKGRLIDTLLGAAPDSTGDAARGQILGSVSPYDRLRSRHPEDRLWERPAQAFAAPVDTGGRARAFVKIQEGCDAFCTFCIIPYARGPARSLAAESAVAHVQTVVTQGVREVVLTGTALGDWGCDLSGTADLPTGEGLERLVRRILAETDVFRLRLGSLDPHELTDGLLTLMAAEPRLSPHAHVSLQSPHPIMLKRMRRRYDADAVVRRLEGIAALGQRLAVTRGLAGGVFVGMDVITGFPGETEEIFAWTRDRLAALPWTRLHVFPYSERAGTPATRLDGAVPRSVRKARTRALMALSNTRLAACAQRVVDAAAPIPVLVESRATDLGPHWLVGRAPNYYRVAFEAPEDVDLGAWRQRQVRVRPRSVLPSPLAGSVRIVGDLHSPVPHPRS